MFMIKNNEKITINVIKKRESMELLGFCNIVFETKQDTQAIMDEIVSIIPTAHQSLKTSKKQVNVADVLNLTLEKVIGKYPDFTVLDVNDEVSLKANRQINWYLG